MYLLSTAPSLIIMFKLSNETKFTDVSDYGRPIANYFTVKLKNTSVTPIQLTLLFGITGIIAIVCLFYGYYKSAAVLLIVKSIIDAMDGSLARLKKTPSYSGRYLDSIFDIILNFLIFGSLAIITKTSFWLAFSSFFCVQLQGTIFNFYYVILRNKKDGGDSTSQIFEYKVPKAFAVEKQSTVNILFVTYTILYGLFDRIVYKLDASAHKQNDFANWFMTLVSLYGLGFQLLIISMMLSLGFINYVIPFFIFYMILMPIIICFRKILFNN